MILDYCTIVFPRKSLLKDKNFKLLSSFQLKLIYKKAAFFPCQPSENGQVAAATYHQNTSCTHWRNKVRNATIHCLENPFPIGTYILFQNTSGSSLSGVMTMAHLNPTISISWDTNFFLTRNKANNRWVTNLFTDVYMVRSLFATVYTLYLSETE